MTPSIPNQPENSTRIFLRVVTGDNCPSFKNRKRAGFTPGNIKKRMTQLENRIVSVLYSSCQTPQGEMDLECLKRLQTALSGLSDDSLVEIPEFSSGVRYVEPGCEGVEIEIERI